MSPFSAKALDTFDTQIYVICRLGGPYREKLWPRAAFSSPRSQFFAIRTNPKLVNNLFIFFQALKRKKELTEKKTYASITVTVVRDRKIRTALRTNQIVGFVTVPAWKEIKVIIIYYYLLYCWRYMYLRGSNVKEIELFLLGTKVECYSITGLHVPPTLHLLVPCYTPEWKCIHAMWQ